ncbi:uncharacterized protein LOC121393326 [Xenopus laevis]|uniref:Uncharacterized protein LOC121393326 n=1 Tax=Xenopus laevis TaxID=8355 RepID=A0A8J1KMJ4_XENLA|nr:uncharacterized protein LOC121393326 [Xenopus laevis]
MARPHTGQLGAHNHSRRVPNSIRQPTSSHFQTLIYTKKLIQKTRPDDNSKRTETKRCHCTSTCRRTLQRFLLESLFGLKEGGYLQTSIKPKNLKQAGVQTEIPHGVHPVGGNVNDPQLFHDQGRPSGCLLACTHQEGIPTISTVYGARRTLPIQGTSFRPFHGTPSVHENTQPIDCTPQESRNLSHTLSGRPPNQSSVLRPESQRHPNLCHNTPTTRLDNKLQKESPHAHTTNSIPRNVVRLIPSDYVSALGEDSNNRTHCSTSLHSDHHFSGTLPPVIRLHGSSVGSTAFRQIPHERLSESLSTPLEQEPLQLVATNSTYHASQTFTDLVDNTTKSFSRQDMGLTPVDRTDHGRQPHRLGGNLATSDLPRDMVTGRIKTPYKCVRNQSNTKCHSSLVSRLTKHTTTHSVRQCHRGCLPQQAGRNPQQQSDEGGSTNTHLGRTSCPSHLRSLHSGRTKLGGGYLSRQRIDQGEWSLRLDVFTQLVTRWGRPDIDMFASRHNFKVPTYCARSQDPKAAYVDALVIPWIFKRVYAFPPLALLPRVIRKIRQERTETILIAPDWPRRPWYSELINMSAAPPWWLPLTPELLTQGPIKHDNLQRLHLMAWLLKPSCGVPKGFPKKPLTFC